MITVRVFVEVLPGDAISDRGYTHNLQAICWSRSRRRNLRSLIAG